MNRIIKTAFILIVLGASGYGIWWKLSQNKAAMEKEVEISAIRNPFIPVRVAKIGKHTFSNDFTAAGTFQPYKEMSVVAEASGKITTLNIENGSYVTAGDTLLIVDNELIRNQMDALVLNKKKAEKDLQRMTNLLAEGGVTQLQLEEAQMGVENLKIKIKSLEKRLRDTYIKAPISGTISGTQAGFNLYAGSFIAPGRPIFNIVNAGRVKLQVALTEDQLVTIRKGQKVRVFADVYPAVEFFATVRHIGIRADMMSKRFPVEVEMTNSRTYPIRGGMNGWAFFEGEEKTAGLAVPREAFAGSVREGKLYVVKSDTAKLRRVETGQLYGDMVPILNGVEEGELVVLSGHINLEDGARVKIIEEERRRGDN